MRGPIDAPKPEGQKEGSTQWKRERPRLERGSAGVGAETTAWG